MAAQRVYASSSNPLNRSTRDATRPPRITRAIAFLSIPGKDYRSVSRKYSEGRAGRGHGAKRGGMFAVAGSPIGEPAAG